jgi:hypothetical protein
MADDRVYRFHVHYVPETERFLALAPELGVEAEGETRAEALEKLEAEVDAEIERVAVEGGQLPKPADLAMEAGTLELELAAPLYRDLLTHATAQGLEPEALALQLLTRALGRLEGRGGPRRARVRGAEAPAEAPERASAEEEAPPKEGGKEGGGRRKKNKRGRRREGYRPDMEDQANFLAYIRDQERGGGGRGRR